MPRISFQQRKPHFRPNRYNPGDPDWASVHLAGWMRPWAAAVPQFDQRRAFGTLLALAALRKGAGKRKERMAA